MRFSILSWNLGYGGMGADAFSLYEGEKHRIRLTRSRIGENIEGIGKTLDALDHDVVLLQEVAGKSILNRWHDLYARIQGSHIERYTHKKAPVFWLPFLPSTHNSEHSLVSAVRSTHSTEDGVHRLRAYETYAGLIKRHDSVVISRIALKRPLTIIHIHLAAFDTHMRTRRAQLSEIIDLALGAHAHGPVVIGGDWNMNLSDTQIFDRPDLPYLSPFAHDLIPKEWKLVRDQSTPSLRSGDRPWGKGAVTAVVDGFVASPDVIVHTVRSHDLGFVHSDHNPVELVLEV